MRYVLTGLLGAALLLGCGDDDTDDDIKPKPDSGATDSGIKDAGSKDAGGGSMDASAPSLDAGPKDSGSSVDSGSGVTTLVSKTGGTVTGTARFALSGGLVTLTLSVKGAVPGLRGAHLHATGKCDPADSFASAGGHWNPDMHNHGSGAPDAGATSHLGDLGNILIDKDGNGTLTHSNVEWKYGDDSTFDVVGKAIVVHENTDDFVTQQNADAGTSPGNSGARLACGVITK